MRLIVIQRCLPDLLAIRFHIDDIDRNLNGRIMWASETEEVLRTVEDRTRTFVISGEVLGLYQRGTVLAQKVKEANPQNIFLIYSTMPNRNEFVDGIISKELCYPDGGPRLVAEIFASIGKDTTIESIRGKFKIY